MVLHQGGLESLVRFLRLLPLSVSSFQSFLPSSMLARATDEFLVLSKIHDSSPSSPVPQVLTAEL